MLFSPRTIRVPFDPARQPHESAQAGRIGLDPAHDRHAMYDNLFKPCLGFWHIKTIAAATQG